MIELLQVILVNKSVVLFILVMLAIIAIICVMSKILSQEYTDSREDEVLETENWMKVENEEDK